MDAIVGKWFHSYYELKIMWQGKILAAISHGFYLIQWFSWVDGEPIYMSIASLGDMREWRFYDTREEASEAYEKTPHFMKHE